MRGIPKTETICYVSHPPPEKCFRKMFLESIGAEGQGRLPGAGGNGGFSGPRGILKNTIDPPVARSFYPTTTWELGLWGLVPFRLVPANPFENTFSVFASDAWTVICPK